MAFSLSQGGAIAGSSEGGFSLTGSVTPEIDPGGAAVVMASLKAKGQAGLSAGVVNAAARAVNNRAYQISFNERNAGVPEPTMTIAPDPDMRRCRSAAMWGYQPVVRGVGGGSGTTIGDVAINLSNTDFPFPGTVALQERANSHAGGSSAMKTDPNDKQYPAVVTVTGGGGCGAPVNVNSEGRFLYSVFGYVESLKAYVGHGYITTPSCLDTLRARAIPALEAEYPGVTEVKCLLGETPAAGSRIYFEC